MGKRKLQKALSIFLVALSAFAMLLPAAQAATDYNAGRRIWYNKWHQECDGKDYPAGHWCTTFKQKCTADNSSCYDWWNYNGRPYENSYVSWDWWDRNCPHDRTWYDRYCRDNWWNQQNNGCCKYMQPRLYGGQRPAYQHAQQQMNRQEGRQDASRRQPYTPYCRYHSSAISYDWWWNNCPRYNGWYDQYCRFDDWNQRNNMCCVFQYPRLYGRGICTD